LGGFGGEIGGGVSETNSHGGSPGLWLGWTEQMTKMTLWAIPDKTTRELVLESAGPEIGVMSHHDN